MIKRYADIREDIADFQTRIEDYVNRDKWRNALDVAKTLLRKYNIDYHIEDIVLSCDFSNTEIETMASSDEGETLFCAAIAYQVYPGFEHMEQEYIDGLFERAANLGITRAFLNTKNSTLAREMKTYIKIAEQGCCDAYVFAARYLNTMGEMLVEQKDNFYRAAWLYREAYLHGYNTVDIRYMFNNHPKETISLYRPGLLPFSWIPEEYQERVITTLMVMKRLCMPAFVRMLICDYVCS